jgi:hypothetical protein
MKNHLLTELNPNKRLQKVMLSYLFFLMVPARKHGFRHAAAFSGLHASQFSRLLANHPFLPVHHLKELGRKRARKYMKIAENLCNGKLPWRVALIIDATIQHRSSLHTENAARFNHGSGFEIGHQWTNIVLMIGEHLIPLPPIAFQTKAYCKKHDLTYKTENQWVTEYLLDLDLESYIGAHDPQNVVVLADSGYDDRKIQKAVLKRRWHFIQALKVTRSAKTLKQSHNSPLSKGWYQVAELFKRARYAGWKTIHIPTNRAKKKRMDLRIRQIKAFLRYVGQVQLVCSEMKNRPRGRRKYLACSNMRVSGRQIVLGYRLRWAIEIFHKEVKSFLGFEDVAAQSFQSVSAHVHWVYCAYLLIHDEIKGVLQDLNSLAERQARVKQVIDSAEKSRAVQILTQFNGAQRYKAQLQQVLAELESGKTPSDVALSFGP